MNLTARGGSVGHFEFSIDSFPSAFYVKSVEGGLPKGNTIEEQIGTHLEFIKHLATVEIEPMSVEIGMQDSIPMLLWIQDSWRRNWSRKDGMIRHANFDYKEVFQHHFYDALLSEVTFPSLDATGKESAFLKVKLQPERIEMKDGDNSAISGTGNKIERQKLWTTSCFRLNLDGFDLSKVAKIDGFTVKQGVKALYTGRDRFPQWEPTKLTFPDLSVHMSLGYAGQIVDWYERVIIKGARDPKEEKTGSIEFLAPNKHEVVFRISLAQVGIKSFTIDKSEKQDAMKRVKFDLYVGQMDLDGDGVLALE